MIEAVLRSKGLNSLAKELGFRHISNVVLGTDSSAAKSFVCRRGLGKMRHIEIRDLWLQKEVREGRLKVVKVLGSENPADLMTKILNIGEIEERLKRVNLMMLIRGDGVRNRLTGREDDDDGWCGWDGEKLGPWICAVDLQEMPVRDDDAPPTQDERCEERRRFNRFGREQRGRSRRGSSRSLMAVESTGASSGTQQRQQPRQRKNSRDVFGTRSCGRSKGKVADGGLLA